MKLEKGWYFPDADEFMVRELQEDGTYQGAHLMAALKYVTDWRLAIDGGAHIGTWSRILSKKFAAVYAFEPSSDTAEALEANLKQFDCWNVVTFQKALSDVPGAVTMTLEGHDQAIKAKNTGARFTKPGGAVKAMTIDSLELPNLGFLKLDIEGSEYRALLGARETLKRHRPVVLWECKPKCLKRFGVTKEMISAFLTSCGYRHAEKAGCDEIWISA